MNINITTNKRRSRRRVTARPFELQAKLLLSTFVLGGCAVFSQDGGFASVQEIATQRLAKDVVWAKSEADRDSIAQRVNELLTKPLSVDGAVQIALLNNRGLQASFSELGISEADLVQAGRLPNPHFAMLRARHGDEFKIEQALTFNIFSLLVMPQAQAVERRRFERRQRIVALDVLDLAAQTRKAYYIAVSADESVRYMEQVKKTADASAELARRMAQIGNFNKLQQAREQAFYADAALALARSQQVQTSARERLTRLLGLWGAQATFALPERLPDLPIQPNELPGLEQQAMAQRLDVQAAKLDVEAMAKNLGLTKTTRFINVLELGPARVLEGQRSDPYKRGFEVSLELPIFDWGTAKVAKAEAIYMQSLNLAAQMAIDARSQVREAYLLYRANYDVVRHYRDEIVPIKKRIAEENMLRYNGMLIGVFELLADARSQIVSVNSYIEALRDFWLAQADLDMALIGKPSISAVPSTLMTGGDARAAH